MQIVQSKSEWLDKNNLSVEEVIEKCGRVCYKSEDKITENSHKQFIKGLIKSGHESVLEHSAIGVTFNFENKVLDYDVVLHLIRLQKANSIFLRFYQDEDDLSISLIMNVRAWRNFFKHIINCNFAIGTQLAVIYKLTEVLYNYSNILFEDIYNETKLFKTNITNEITTIPQEFTNKHYKTFHLICDRATSHQIVRHRKLSFSQESMRYCNYSKDKFDNNIQVIKPVGIETLSQYNLWQQSCKSAEDYYFNLIREGCKPEEARSVLPQCTKTEMYISGFTDDLEYMLNLRTKDDVQKDLRDLMINLKKGF